MSLRTIMIFPEFENQEIIDNIREKYDPLAGLVSPHITLVFPFESSMSNEELERVLNDRLMSIKPFELKLGGISKQEDRFGNYLFLNVQQGAKELKCINRILYDNEFREFDAGLPYVPHMTVGKLATPQLMNEAFAEIESVGDTFDTVVRKISVEMIGANEESIIVIEKELEEREEETMENEFSEYATFTVTAKDGTEVEMAVVDEFEFEGKHYVVGAVIKDDTIQDDAQYIYRSVMTEDGFTVEKIKKEFDYKRIAKAYMEME